MLANRNRMDCNMSSLADRDDEELLRSGTEEQQPPASKKQRREQDDAAADATEKWHLDGPPEDEQRAEKKLAKAGFDRGNYTEAQLIDFRCDDGASVNALVGPTPLVYFCYKGDIKMVRYLLTKGASVHAASNNPSRLEDFNIIWYPMYAAALATARGDMREKLAICKLLHENGCEINRACFIDSTFQRIGRRSGPGKSSLVWPPSDVFEVRKWFILNGALCNEAGEIADMVVLRDLFHNCSAGHEEAESEKAAIRRELLLWAKQAVQTHNTFHIFLLGAFATRPTQVRATSRSVAPLSRLSGNAGVLERIADFVGVVRGKELRLMRQLSDSIDFQMYIETRRLTLRK